MHISLNARHMMKDRLEGIGTVTHEIMSRIVHTHPGDQFDYYFDREFDKSFIHGSTVKGHSFFPPARLPILIRYWMDKPVRHHVIKMSPDVFFSPDGFLPKNLKVPTVTMVHDIAFLRNPLHVKPRIRRFYDQWMPIYIKDADHIITVSQFSKKEIVAGYGVDPDKISVVYNGVSKKYHPITPEAAQDVRDQHIDGKPFFLYLGAIHPRKNILSLVRAFEKFKNDTGSDFHLVIAGRPSWYTKEVFKAVENSKWQEVIHLPGFIESETARNFMASAHALIYPSRYEGFGLPVVEAMASGTPVICSDVASLPEIAGDAALFFDPGDIDALVAHLKNVAFDHDLRSRLSQAGHQRVQKFSWDDAAKSVYGILKNFT
ncbi:MAG: glycosyltransferase family 4 protein [Bacteroidota bacterium]|nr:glycosyltransferase family 4 protein [Bacteroidota bacterium]